MGGIAWPMALTAQHKITNSPLSLLVKAPT